MAACKPNKQPADPPLEQRARIAAELAPAGVAADAPPEPLDDADITAAIRRELRMDGVADIGAIDVITRDGIVTLAGRVESLLARERAVRVAELVKGVRAVHHRLAVVPRVARDAAALRADIESALREDPVTASHGIAVEVDQGVATLTGAVPSWQARWLAEYVVQGVKGVTGLRNRIRVEHAGKRSDLEIEREIAQRMRWDVLLDAGMIDIAVEHGVVRLHGTVRSAAERGRAFHDAWVAGVSSVEPARLEVVWWARPRRLRQEANVIRSDAAVEQAVIQATRYDPRVSGFRIEPEATAGMVTLWGTVDTLEARRAAEQLARNTVGVVSVKSFIKVSVQPPVDSAALVDRVLRALARNPITDGHDLRAAVEDGVVTLTGGVGHYSEKIEAENVIEGLPGVVEVQNEIAVKHTSHAFVQDPYLYPYHPQLSESLDRYIPTTQARNDVRIHAAIESELAWSPFVDAREIHVSVIDGRATLIGTVDSWRERQVATDNAFEGGAVAVVNRLGVIEN
jgi:osmotically-inducible protein OsmY